MCNVDDIIPFTLTLAPADGGSYTYVWNWWDGTSNTTSVPTISKKMNTGGTLFYDLVQSDAYGRSVTYAGTVIVNTPPVIIGAPTVSANDAIFPFNTVLTSVSYDPDHPGGTELSFGWYDGATLISSGTTAVLSTGTYQNQLEVDAVSSNRTLTQVITDTQNGATRVNFYMRGTDPTGLQGSSSSISNSIISSASNLSEIIIGPDAQVTFTAFANDQTQGQLQFVWTLSALNGWSSDFSFTDTPAPLPSGLYKSQITRSVASESAGTKIAVCTVTNLSTGQTISFNTTVQLVNPKSPTVTAISTDAPVINGGYAVAQAGFIHFSAQASDPNSALLDYRWDFTQPLVTLYGKTVMLRPSDYGVFAESTLESSGTNTGGPAPILGGVTVTDRFGKTSTISLQSFITTLVWPNTQLSPSTSGSGSTTLQKRYFGLSSLEALQIADLSALSTDFASSRNFTQAFNPLDQFIYFIYPASYGTGTFTVDGAVSSEWLLTAVTYNSVLYNVYRSATTLTGLKQVTVN